MEIVNNTKSWRFETDVNGGRAYLQYAPYEGGLKLIHTFVPESARGEGVSSALAKYALEFAKQQDLKLIVYCTAVLSYLKKHPEYNFLVEKEQRK